MLLRKRTFLTMISCCIPFLFSSLTNAVSEELQFQEVWAYLLSGEERFLSDARPVTDLGYFGAGLDSSGKLIGVPKRDKVEAFGGRVHLVIAELGNYALAHFCLSPDYPIRDALIADITSAASSYDGVQIDFEAVDSRDYENFFVFLTLLKNHLGDKVLSIAIAAKYNEKTDHLNYQRVARIVDRVVVMAYDEHWSTSAPGPIASIEWCRDVANYARTKIPREKLVMGAPFYGRAWADKNLSRAYKYSSLTDLIAEKGITEIRREAAIPFVEYVETVRVKAFFDDSVSILVRLNMYQRLDIQNIAFWKLGQEDTSVWEHFVSAADAALPKNTQESPR